MIQRLELLSKAMLNLVVHKVSTGLERVTLYFKRNLEGNVINLPLLVKWERKHMGKGKGLQPCGGTDKNCAKVVHVTLVLRRTCSMPVLLERRLSVYTT